MEDLKVTQSRGRDNKSHKCVFFLFFTLKHMSPENWLPPEQDFTGTWVLSTDHRPMSRSETTLEQKTSMCVCVKSQSRVLCSCDSWSGKRSRVQQFQFSCCSTFVFFFVFFSEWICTTLPPQSSFSTALPQHNEGEDGQKNWASTQNQNQILKQLHWALWRSRFYSFCCRNFPEKASRYKVLEICRKYFF